MPTITGNTFVDAALFVAILIMSVVLHEVTHGVVAYRLGDDTAKRAGRLTLNPIKHLDPMGSVVLPGLLALARQPVFGWAKPVPVDPRRFRNPAAHMAITAIAGPLVNLAVAFLAARVALPAVESEAAATVVVAVVVINVVLAVFNLLPIPPLDGSRLLLLVLNESGRRALAQVERYGFLILFLLLFVFDRAFDRVFLPVLEWVLRLVAG